MLEWIVFKPRGPESEGVFIVRVVIIVVVRWRERERQVSSEES